MDISMTSGAEKIKTIMNLRFQISTINNSRSIGGGKFKGDLFKAKNIQRGELATQVYDLLESVTIEELRLFYKESNKFKYQLDSESLAILFEKISNEEIVMRNKSKYFSLESDEKHRLIFLKTYLEYLNLQDCVKLHQTMYRKAIIKLCELVKVDPEIWLT
jgi:hypothetical protein